MQSMEIPEELFSCPELYFYLLDELYPDKKAAIQESLKQIIGDWLQETFKLDFQTIDDGTKGV